MKTIDQFIELVADEFDMPLEKAGEMLHNRLEELRIPEQHVVWYINYPGMTETEIAEECGVTQQAVHQALARLRKKFRSTNLDLTGFHGEVKLRDMKRIEFSDSERLDEDKIIKF